MPNSLQYCKQHVELTSFTFTLLLSNKNKIQILTEDKDINFASSVVKWVVIE